MAERSRYADVERTTAEITGPDGGARTVACLGRRFLPPLTPPPPQMAESGVTVSPLGQVLMAHPVDASDRLDMLAWVALGDSLLYWRIADANRCVFPDELTATLGDVIVMPTAVGRESLRRRA